jgi:hypothetical protein
MVMVYALGVILTIAVLLKLTDAKAKKGGGK